jgi:hypothetical protein
MTYPNGSSNGSPVAAGPAPGLRISARQCFEAARILDRVGDAFLTVDYAGTALLLVDEVGVGQPTLGVELDREGKITGYRYLSYYVEPEDDGLGDLAEEEEEEPLAVCDPIRGGRQAGKALRMHGSKAGLR